MTAWGRNKQSCIASSENIYLKLQIPGKTETNMNNALQRFTTAATSSNLSRNQKSNFCFAIKKNKTKKKTHDPQKPTPTKKPNPHLQTAIWQRWVNVISTTFLPFQTVLLNTLIFHISSKKKNPTAEWKNCAPTDKAKKILIRNSDTEVKYLLKTFTGFC